MIARHSSALGHDSSTASLQQGMHPPLNLRRPSRVMYDTTLSARYSREGLKCRVAATWLTTGRMLQGVGGAEQHMWCVLTVLRNAYAATHQDTGEQQRQQQQQRRRRLSASLGGVQGEEGAGQVQHQLIQAQVWEGGRHARYMRFRCIPGRSRKLGQL